MYLYFDKKVVQKKVVINNSIKPKKSFQPIHQKNFSILGIGAFAGGLDALKLFFNNTPVDSGMAFIIVQHLDPKYKRLLSELIVERTKMKVSKISDGIIIKPVCAYVIPPNKDLTIFKGVLQLTNPKEQDSRRRYIESFFHSLAEDQKELAGNNRKSKNSKRKK